ncbi:MAG: hypothetical protein RLZZ450_487 [Pseudomonadota bacterium]
MSAGVFRCLLLGVLLACGCVGGRRDRDPPPVCVRPLPAHLQHTAPDALPAVVWYELLFKGYRDGISADLVDCSGEPIAWAPLPSSCVEGEPESTVRQRRRALRADELIIRHAGGEYWFGWAPFLAFDNGMSEGPLAIARVHAGKLEVRALGTLRAYSKRVRLEIRKLGQAHILVAEGEWCGASASPRSPLEQPSASTCARGTRLLWLDRQRFRERPLRSLTVRSCLGPAWFPQTDVRATQLNTRWSRTLQRDLALAYEDELITVDEHITVSDLDVSSPSLPARRFREAQARIRVSLEAGELLSEGQSLWNAIRTEDGATGQASPP